MTGEFDIISFDPPVASVSSLSIVNFPDSFDSGFSSNIDPILALSDSEPTLGSLRKDHVPPRTSFSNYNPKTGSSAPSRPIQPTQTKYKREMVRIKPLQLQTKYDLFPQLFSIDDMLEASLETRTKKVYSQRFLRFIDWLKASHAVDSSIPFLNDLVKSCSVSEIDTIIASYLVCKFNQRANSGGTLAGDLSAIMFGLQKEGMIINGELLSSCNRVIKGATNLVRMYKNPNIGLGARALLNPMLNAMLKHCKNPLQRLRLLVPSRFGLRAEHVCCNCKGSNKLDRHLKH